MAEAAARRQPSGIAQPQVRLASIQVSPATATVVKGRSQQFTASGQYSDGSTRNLTASVTWAAAPAGVVSITAGGLAQGLAEGQVTITASSEGLSNTSRMEVGPAQLASVSISTPANMMLGNHSPCAPPALTPTEASRM